MGHKVIPPELRYKLPGSEVQVGDILFGCVNPISHQDEIWLDCWEVISLSYRGIEYSWSLQSVDDKEVINKFEYKKELEYLVLKQEEKKEEKKDMMKQTEMTFEQLEQEDQSALWSLALSEPKQSFRSLWAVVNAKTGAIYPDLVSSTRDEARAKAKTMKEEFPRRKFEVVELVPAVSEKGEKLLLDWNHQ